MEVESPSLGDREHELPVRDLSANVFSDPARLLQGPFLAAARAKAAAKTGKRHEQLVPALRTAHPGEPVPEIATLQKLLDGRVDDWPPEAITFLLALCIDSLELRIEALDQLTKRGLLRLVRAIKTAQLLGSTDHDRPPPGRTPWGRSRPGEVEDERCRVVFQPGQIHLD